MLRIGFLALAIGFFCSSLWAQERIVIQGGTLVDVRDGSLKPNTTVVIEGDRIVSVGGQAPSGGTVVDATGKYLIPGLIDLHLHYKEWAPELYLNHGVTTAVDLGADHEWMKAQKEALQKQLFLGPRLFIGTNNFDGPPANPNTYFVRPYVEILKGPEEATMAMRRYIDEKVDAVKIYDGLPLETLRAVGREAKKANIPVIGHFKNIQTAIDTGGSGLEHLAPVANDLLDKQAHQEALKKVRNGFDPPKEAFMDFAKAPALIQSMVRNNLYLNPTLTMSWLGDRALREKRFHYMDFDLLFNNWNLRYIPIQWKLADLKEFQENGMWHWADLSKYEQDLFHQGYENSLRFVKMFVDAGGKLYAGTDCANMCTPGLGTHEELELIAASGAGPLKALQAATINPAELMRMPDRLGAIEVGKAADVVILDANPLEDITNTRKIYKVISQGRLLDGKYHADFRNPIPKNSFEDSSHFFPSPRIRWTTPESMLAGKAETTVSVHGTGFIPYSFVRWNGERLKTQFVSSFELKAEVPVELLNPGTYAITIENPDFAWGTIFARGGSDLSHLGVRGPVSNEFLVLVKPPGGAPIFPHPRESAAKEQR